MNDNVVTLKKPRVSWGEIFAKYPVLKAMRDETIASNRKTGLGSISTDEVLSYLERTNDRAEKLEILGLAGYVWDGDEGYGGFPRDDTTYSWCDE